MKWLVLASLLAVTACHSPQPIQSFDHPKFNSIKPRLTEHLERYTLGVSKRPFTTMVDINLFVNRVPYKIDPKDKWQLPYKFLETSGDCEDYAVAKYALAIYNRVIEPSEGQIVLVLNKYDSVHAVLVVDGLVYDNEQDEISTIDEYVIIGGVKM